MVEGGGVGGKIGWGPGERVNWKVDSHGWSLGVLIMGQAMQCRTRV